MFLFICIMITTLVGAFIPYPFGKPFSISNRETVQKIIRPDLHSINGFFGMIGPDVNVSNIQSLYELFTGDGVIHGVFFQNGTLTYVNHFIRTEKLVYEEVHGRMPTDPINTFFFIMIEAMRIFPNCIDVANTAILRTKHHLYALFERDVPYRISVNQNDQTIETVLKDTIFYPVAKHVSAHSKYDEETDTLETIDYRVMSQTVHYRRLLLTSDPATELSHIELPMKYMPITHDFVSTTESIVVIDSPNKLQHSNLSSYGMPVHFCSDLPTYIYVVNKRTRDIETYTYPTGFYIFHFASATESRDHIEILASIYRELDMNSLNLHGTYSKLVLNKQKKTCSIYTTRELQQYNLEFPVRYGDSIVMRHLHDNKARCFVICKDLRIQQRIWLCNLSICGEPVIVDNNGIPTLLCFTSNDTHSYLTVVALSTLSQIHIPIQNDIRIGFHSIYLHGSEKNQTIQTKENIVPLPINP